MDYEKAYKEALELARSYYDENTNQFLDTIFPELRESEDFDEKVRKWLVDYFSSIKDTVWIHRNTITCEQILDWLEKQKINTEGDFGRGYDCGYQAGYAVAVNEMKPKVATATLATLDSEKQKEQKPELVQQPPITYTYNSNASRDERLKSALLALLNSDLLKVKEGGYFTKQDLIEWVEKQKPAECIEDSVKFEEGFKVGRESGLRDGQKYVLNNLDSYGLCKPAWSEEDEEDNIYLLLCMVDAVDSIPYINGTLRVSDEKKKELKEFIKRPSWKPSDEQMEALMLAIEGKCPPTSYMSRRLEDLYDGLANTYKIDAKLD